MVAPLPLHPDERTVYKKLKAQSGGFTLRFLGITYMLLLLLLPVTPDQQESRNFQHIEFVGSLRSTAHIISPVERTEFFAAFTRNT